MVIRLQLQDRAHTPGSWNHEQPTHERFPSGAFRLFSSPLPPLSILHSSHCPHLLTIHNPITPNIKPESISITNPDQNVFAGGLPPTDFLPPTPHSHPISSSVGSIYSPNIITNPNPYTALPQVYYSQPPPQRPHSQLTSYTEDLLFYIVYGPQFEPTTPHSARVLALKELYSRGWRCHDEKNGKDACANFWMLPMTTQTDLSTYSHLDLNGSAQYQGNIGLAGSGTSKQSNIHLTFNPEKWYFVFINYQIKSKPMVVDELLK